ncbi:hypothetical protein F2Q69_00027832 [Brassica cretica]|uniref:Uncharacterized protein n=1 Tax=Brassica cretica TaxID=69181 RepID=A0A8S9S5H6_BRACR|nr:hypothetical protein F2Q69_00027832 [Brassica cretica]
MKGMQKKQSESLHRNLEPAPYRFKQRSLWLCYPSSLFLDLIVFKEMIPDFITECGASHLVTDFSPLREIRSCREEVVKRTSEEVVKMVLSSFQVPPPEYTFLAYLCFSYGNYFKVLEYHMEFLKTFGYIWSSREVIRVIFGQALPGAISRSDYMKSL